MPRFFQKNFAVDDQVDVWVLQRGRFERRNIDTAGTRSRYYRRERLDGTSIDDVEASLSVLEDKSRDGLLELVEGQPLDLARKSAVSQLLGMQLVRGEHFFADRSALMEQRISELPRDAFTSAARAPSDDDLAELRAGAAARQVASTPKLVSMLRLGSRLGALLANMRWQLLEFEEPCLAYSDHPVVVWPADRGTSEPFSKQQHGPAGACEVRCPLSPRLAVLMTWLDEPDARVQLRSRTVASELNAFTISQADRQWMRTPGIDVPIATGALNPLGPRLDGRYTRTSIVSSRRRAFVEDVLRKGSDLPVPRKFDVLNISPMPGDG